MGGVLTNPFARGRRVTGDTKTAKQSCFEHIDGAGNAVNSPPCRAATQTEQAGTLQTLTNPPN